MKALIRLLCCLAALMPALAFAASDLTGEPDPAEVVAAGVKAKEKDGEKPDAKAEDEAEQKAEAPAQEQAWQAVWSGQREMVNEIRETAIKLRDNFSGQTEDLASKLRPFEEEARRLLVFITTFHGHPNAMEAVNRRLGATIGDIDQVLQPVNVSRAEAEGLLERVNNMAANLPDDEDKSRFSKEMQAYIQDITHARLRLTAVIAQYDSLLPSLQLVKKLEEKRQEIAAELPGLWERFYLQKPLPWLDPERWGDLKTEMYYSWQALILRLPVELPGTTPQWGMAIIRFFIGLAFASILSLILRKKLLKPGAPAVMGHIFKVSLPWAIVGFALVGSAVSATGDFFRLFLALGASCVLLGQLYLAWDLRRLQYPDVDEVKPPFLRLLPLAFLAYALFYLPLTESLALVLWTIVIVVRLWRLRRQKAASFGSAQMEGGALECENIILWICLFLSVSGLHIYSMILYLLYIASAVACELSIAGMAIVGNINEHLPQEGVRAALARLLVALAAPFVLVLAGIGFCLWIAMLPGGTYLLAEYAFKGIRLGETQLNIIQALLIISAFYITRTIVSMGTRLLARLPQQGIHFDSTLITPMQTFLTYATWAVFGLFVLHSLGMELSNLAMVAGGLSVGIGFGMQTIVNNFLSGLILIFGRTLQVGDVVEVANLTGRVRKISVRATMVETYDNAIIYVPNSEFMSGKLINWTSFSRSVRRIVTIGVAYGSDTEKVIKLLIEIAGKHENVLKYPVPSVHFSDFGASTLDFQLRFWVRDYDLGAQTMSDIRLEINERFNAEKIEIAFPQLDVHLKDAPPLKMAPLPPKAASPARKRPRPAVKRKNAPAPTNDIPRQDDEVKEKPLDGKK